jgi:hypothetical protein
MDEGMETAASPICAAIIDIARETAPLVVSLSGEGQRNVPATVTFTVAIQRSADGAIRLDATLERADFDERMTAPPFALSVEPSSGDPALRDALMPLLGRFLPWLRR